MWTRLRQGAFWRVVEASLHGPLTSYMNVFVAWFIEMQSETTFQLHFQQINRSKELHSTCANRSLRIGFIVVHWKRRRWTWKNDSWVFKIFSPWGMMQKTCKNHSLCIAICCPDWFFCSNIFGLAKKPAVVEIQGWRRFNWRIWSGRRWCSTRCTYLRFQILPVKLADSVVLWMFF